MKRRRLHHPPHSPASPDSTPVWDLSPAEHSRPGWGLPLKGKSFCIPGMSSLVLPPVIGLIICLLVKILSGGRLSGCLKSRAANGRVKAFVSVCVCGDIQKRRLHGLNILHRPVNSEPVVLVLAPVVKRQQVHPADFTG